MGLFIPWGIAVGSIRVGFAAAAARGSKREMSISSGSESSTSSIWTFRDISVGLDGLDVNWFGGKMEFMVVAGGGSWGEEALADGGCEK